MKKIALLGATGSIGTSTVEVVRAYPERFQVVSLTFQNNMEKARQLLAEFRPQFVGTGTAEQAKQLKQEFPKIIFDYGETGLVQAACWETADIVLTAVSGSIGLLPTLKAISCGKNIALANKESLVMGGSLVMDAVQENQVNLLPVDSEHSAIFQCLAGQNDKDLDQLVITASGGSFRDFDREELKSVSIEHALKHPNWSMGKKITIDSATMMNKGLEVIEAHWLFGVDYDKIKVVLHRESLVHSMIVLNDGAYLAQLGASDMREPIQYALTYPERLPLKNQLAFDLTEIGSLNFAKMDFVRFPMLQLAYEVGAEGNTFPTVYNAANEVAVWAFINGEISYLAIEDYVMQAVAEHRGLPVKDLNILLEVDKETRRKVRAQIERRN